jgi:CcmD family protein
MGSLIAAYTVAWGVLMLYVLTLAARQRKLHRSLQKLESVSASSITTPGPHAR